MVLRMKTTIDIPDELLIQAKKRAAELRRPLRTLVIEGLRRELLYKDTLTHNQDNPKPPFRWVLVPGELNPDLNLNDRASMNDWLKSHSC